MFIEKMIKLLESVEIISDDKESIRSYMKENQEKFIKDPRADTDENKTLLRIILLILQKKAEDEYGVSENIALHFQPILWDRYYSQIGPLLNDNNKFGLAVASFAKTWEQIFYEISHESVHLLNPIADVKNNIVSTLEEGVAVKFAEETYTKYISSYTKEEPAFSPIQDISSQYYIAFQATKKIPDPILKEIRAKFGRFSKIDDLERFRYIVQNYISESETADLYKPFSYPSIQW